jgi:hypothetical protein
MKQNVKQSSFIYLTSIQNTKSSKSVYLTVVTARIRQKQNKGSDKWLISNFLETLTGHQKYIFFKI